MIELIIVVAIIGILAAIVAPSYTSQVKSGYISDALSRLTTASLSMEEKYQENRSYQSGPNTCAVANFTSQYFSFTCTSTARNNYLWTASNLGGTSMGSAGAFTYTINQDSVKNTVKYDGSGPYNDWKK